MTDKPEPANDTSAPDPVANFLAASKWVSLGDDLWRHPDEASDAMPHHADDALSAQISADENRLEIVSYVVHAADEDCREEQVSAEHYGRLVSSHGECSFCHDRGPVAKLHSSHVELFRRGVPIELAICRSCAVAAAEKA